MKFVWQATHPFFPCCTVTFRSELFLLWVTMERFKFEGVGVNCLQSVEHNQSSLDTEKEFGNKVSEEKDEFHVVRNHALAGIEKKQKNGLRLIHCQM